MPVEYEVNGGGLYQIEVNDVTDNDCIADLCADDYYRNHGGGQARVHLSLRLRSRLGKIWNAANM